MLTEEAVRLLELAAHYVAVMPVVVPYEPYLQELYLRAARDAMIEALNRMEMGDEDYDASVAD